MLNKNLKLNPKFFDNDCEKVAIRDGFGAGLLRAGENDEKVVALSADLSYSMMMSSFKEKFPARYVEVGVAEQNMATLASGLANYGKIPFMGSFAVFSPGRNWEQIRTTIALNNLPVKIVGGHAGVGVGPDGATHQALEDIALMRVLPNMTVVVPCDSKEAEKAAIAAAKTNGSVYIRITRQKSPVLTTEETPFEIGKANLVWQAENPQIGIIACGPSVADAVSAAKELETEGIFVSVLNNHTIKPLHKNSIIDLAKKTKAIVTVEDHQIAGGMGSAVAELLAENFPTTIEFVGIKDEFGQSGTQEDLYKHYGLDAQSIKTAVKKTLKSIQKDL
ncbi:MAG: transketolase C-terminal domain-containing protein [Candidatus Paceibacterota bacterium]